MCKKNIRKNALESKGFSQILKRYDEILMLLENKGKETCKSTVSLKEKVEAYVEHTNAIIEAKDTEIAYLKSKLAQSERDRDAAMSKTCENCDNNKNK